MGDDRFIANFLAGCFIVRFVKILYVEYLGVNRTEGGTKGVMGTTVTSMTMKLKGSRCS
jgi:hypothetical protein